MMTSAVFLWENVVTCYLVRKGESDMRGVEDIQAYCLDVNENGVLYKGRFKMITGLHQAMGEYMGGDYRELPVREDLVILTAKDPAKPLNRMYVKAGEKPVILRGNLVCVRKLQGCYGSMTEEDVIELRQCLKPVFDLDGYVYIPGE